MSGMLIVGQGQGQDEGQRQLFELFSDLQVRFHGVTSHRGRNVSSMKHFHFIYQQCDNFQGAMLINPQILKFIYSNQSLTRNMLLKFPQMRNLLQANIISLFFWRSSFHVNKKFTFLLSFPLEEVGHLTTPSHMLH